MKKRWWGILCVCCIFFAACNRTGKGEPTVTDEYQQQEESLAKNEVTATVAPSNAPSQAPDQEPSQEPSREPSQEPSQEPGEAPEQEPSQAPEQEPSQAPEQEPSQAPDQEPSQAPDQEAGVSTSPTPTQQPPATTAPVMTDPNQSEENTIDTDTYYVVSDTIVKPWGEIVRADGQPFDGDSKVLILDCSFQVVEEFTNAAGREYITQVKGNTPFELGMIHENSEQARENKNCFGWYSIQDKKFLLPQEYYSIESLGTDYMIATTFEHRYDAWTLVGAVYDKYGKKYVDDIDKNSLGQLYKEGSYYWHVKSDNTSDIYDEHFTYQKTVENSGNILYYEDGSVRMTKDKILEELGINDTEIMFRQNGHAKGCWPSFYPLICCAISRNGDTSYQSFDDYVLNDQFEVLAKQDCTGGTVFMYEDGFQVWNDGAISGLKEYDNEGNRIKSSTGVLANGRINTEDGYVYYGYDQNQVVIFERDGSELADIPFQELSSIEYQFLFQYGSVTGVFIDNYESFPVYIYSQGKLVYECISDNSFPQYLRNEDDQIVLKNQECITVISKDGVVINEIPLEGRTMLELRADGFVALNQGELVFYNYQNEMVQTLMKLQ